MEQIQNELRAEGTPVHVEIIGVNRKSDAGYNPLVTFSRTLPWLQATNDADPWALWNVTYRDVWILDGENNRVGDPYNLTSHDLQSPAYHAEMKARIVAAAQPVDGDGDSLRDDWERLVCGGIDKLSSAQADDDGDGCDNWTEYVCGSHPLDPGSLPEVKFLRWPESGEFYPAIEIRRRPGAAEEYAVQRSRTLRDWTADGIVPVGEMEVLYDGTGLAIERFRAESPFEAGADAEFFRMRVAPTAN